MNCGDGPVFLLVHDDYAAGGLQRSAMAIADALRSAGYPVTIFCVKVLDGGLSEFHEFVVPLVQERSSRASFWFTAILRLRQLMQENRPRAFLALGLTTSCLLPMAAVGLKEQVLIGSERLYPGAYGGRLFGALRRWAFPRLNAIVCQTADAKNWFSSRLRIPDERLYVIPNVVSEPVDWTPPSFANELVGTPKLLFSIGRLDPQKGFDFAMRAFALLASKRSDVSLVIVGDGPYETELLRVRAELNLETRVEFRGPTKNMAALWRQAYALLFTSRYEGFPNVLAEAMAHGIPAVAFDCPTGPSELISNGIDGFVIPLGDIKLAADRCAELLDHPRFRDEMGRRAMSISKRYNAKVVRQSWLDLLRRLECPSGESQLRARRKR